MFGPAGVFHSASPRSASSNPGLLQGSSFSIWRYFSTAFSVSSCARAIGIARGHGAACRQNDEQLSFTGRFLRLSRSVLCCSWAPRSSQASPTPHPSSLPRYMHFLEWKSAPPAALEAICRHAAKPLQTRRRSPRYLRETEYVPQSMRTTGGLPAIAAQRQPIAALRAKLADAIFPWQIEARHRCAAARRGPQRQGDDNDTDLQSPPGARDRRRRGGRGGARHAAGAGGRTTPTRRSRNSPAARAPAEGRVKLDLPEIAENGNTVPMTVTVESPMTEQSHVTDVLVVADGNPRAGVATFHFSPASGVAEANTRIRLADHAERHRGRQDERRLVLHGEQAGQGHDRRLRRLSAAVRPQSRFRGDNNGRQTQNQARQEGSQEGRHRRGQGAGARTSWNRASARTAPASRSRARS